MKGKMFVVFAGIAFTFILSSCSATLSTSTSSTMSQMKAEPMALWTRPLEVGFTVIGMGEGSSETSQMEGSLSSKKVVDSAPSFFLGGSVPDRSLSPMAKLAAYNAIQKAGADGMYVIMVKEESDGSVKKAWVKGLLLKLGVYGPVSAERADARKCGCGKHSKKEEKDEPKPTEKPVVNAPLNEHQHHSETVK
ncbi:MAG TPA: hypothetical protein PKN76_10075 [bacterium]|nr:hypothetical protein [bacterium]HNZ54471.1 hypothetical protein [bacterium]HPV21892.1 hypothetical protein [bacterium]